MDSVHSTRGARRGAPPSGQRLTRDVVIARAEQLITRNGLGAFSLRSLANALGVRPNALYNHVRSRDELLDAVAERSVSGLRLPPTGQPWPDWVRAVATELRAQLIENPGLTELMLARAGATATGPAVLERFLDHLEAEGLDRAVAHLAWHTMLTVVVGSLVPESARGPRGERTFGAVLDVSITGVRAAAQQPPSAQASALLRDHTLDGATATPR
ncbi:MAG TPA: TetR family transcriptional regulator [Jiangellaceae bacterium]|nr:TetR family transcriptional regulator [Jiangellaceae bacterium]